MTNFYDIKDKELKNITIDVDLFYQKLEAKEECLSDYHGDLGNVSILSKIKGSHIYSCQFDANFRKNMRVITERNPFPLIGMYFSQEGHSYQKMNIDKGTYKFNPHQNGLFFMNEGLSGEGLYEKESSVKFTSFYFTTEFFKQLSEMYPERLASCFKRFEQGESFSLTDETMPITHEMQHILYQINQANLLGNSNTMYAEAKVIELLALQFDLASQKSTRKTETHLKTNSDYHKIHEARHILLSDICNPPSIKELSLKVGINEDKLKKGFKEVFGSTVFGYLYQHKMHLAKQYLLDSSLLVNEIALLCGYDYVSHFSTAFKRFWGCTPGEMRG